MCWYCLYCLPLKTGCRGRLTGIKETYYKAEETYYKAKETYYKAKETYQGRALEAGSLE